MLLTQLLSVLCDPVDHSPPGSSVLGIFQARILEWVAIPFSRGSSGLRDRTWVSCMQTDSLSSKPPEATKPFLHNQREAPAHGKQTKPVNHNEEPECHSEDLAQPKKKKKIQSNNFKINLLPWRREQKLEAWLQGTAVVCFEGLVEMSVKGMIKKITWINGNEWRAREKVKAFSEREDLEHKESKRETEWFSSVLYLHVVTPKLWEQLASKILLLSWGLLSLA